ncbi:hypothetical protein A2Z33_03515 [Candidatus Gottesmanbacteria bacterium RBG_16_52_11]|uniref:FAD-binding FR-type domain-containing protein n=1 Tax=Candidatus Gottesmanbacteria bacterium RBG_16_52_11 TaxID=1798374 RepID=A0A1F5YVP2_9BACT|nr:MAG: hypothetical protein A2Z33_03515 [Candidatus Gottesmanbacteria bacterium RBG_16_52_11]
MLTYTKPQHFQSTVLTKETVTDKVYRVRYQLTEPQEISYYAGQTIMLTVAPSVHRAMSIASPPQEKTVITTYQDVSPMGPGSLWMLHLNTGDRAEFLGPLGRFTVDKESPRKKVLVATGTGIAPFRSMLLDETDQRISGDPVSLYWGLRHAGDIYLQDELQRIASDRKSFEYRLTLSKPEESWQGLRGYVQDHVFAQETDLPDKDFYLCGNKNMIIDMQQKLMSAGVPKQQIRNDPFY